MSIRDWMMDRAMKTAVRHNIDNPTDRTWQRTHAYRNGFFWAACPLCGNGFSGAEWHSYNGLPASIPTGPGSGKGICPDCTRAGRGVESTMDSDVPNLVDQRFVQMIGQVWNADTPSRIVEAVRQMAREEAMR